MSNPSGTRREPPYLRILADLESRIESEDLRPGDVLPTRAELARTYATARATVDKALAELSRKGLIESKSGKRTHVLAPPKLPETTTIGVLWNWPEDQKRIGTDYLDLLFRGIREACAEFMLTVQFRDTPLHTYREFVESTGAQGLLIVRPDYADTSTIDEIHASGIPVIVVPGVLDESIAPSISADNASGTKAAVRHLVDLGHREIGFVGLTATVPDHFERLQAFLGALASSGLSVRPEWIRIAHEKNPALFRDKLSNWLSQEARPTAVFACDFMMALATLGRLKELSLDVPGDVSVVTFDDPPVAAQMLPALTAVAQPVPRLGYRAIERLRECIAGKSIPHIDRIETRLVVRDSTAPPSR